MAEIITIDTKDIRNAAIVVVLLIVAVIVGAMGAMYIFSPGLRPGGTSQATPVVEPTPTPAPVPASYVTDDVTITSMSTSNGWPKVTVQDGREFAVPWNEYDNILSLGDIVHFTVTGTTVGNSGETVYEASSVTVVYKENYYGEDDSYPGFPIIYGPSVVSSSNGGYPIYYYDQSSHSAWQYDGHRSDPISVKELRGQHVIRGRPPH